MEFNDETFFTHQGLNKYVIGKLACLVKVKNS